MTEYVELNSDNCKEYTEAEFEQKLLSLSKNIIYPLSQFDQHCENGQFASFFYLHGKLDDEINFDLCNFSMELVNACKTIGVKDAIIKMPNGMIREVKVIVSRDLDMRQTTGLIVFADDMDSIPLAQR